MTTIQVSRIPSVIDGLLKTFRAMPETQGPPPVEVFDGYPGGLPPDKCMGVGGWDLTAAQGVQDPRGLGVVAGLFPSRDETFVVQCWASAYVGGVDADVATVSDAQKQARDQAFTLVQGAETALVNDPSLVSALGGAGLGTGWIRFARIQLDESFPGDQDLGKGRRANVVFDLEVFSILYTT